ncbi:hypothetical protein SAMN05216559_0394 [Halomicrobium zhouii]|uniref:Uncharacterized protein n=1 Tax=Halomicrobium zhouii TaxID=767519 RepID=A0A1I6K918_9EURY|nr:hypothetical protein SAMN05216559_0394 [Halomicrobium zhouii]
MQLRVDRNRFSILHTSMAMPVCTMTQLNYSDHMEAGGDISSAGNSINNTPIELVEKLGS